MKINKGVFIKYIFLILQELFREFVMLSVGNPQASARLRALAWLTIPVEVCINSLRNILYIHFCQVKCDSSSINTL